jgi:glutaminase
LGLFFNFRDELYKWIGKEPSGNKFNTPIFDNYKRPHNALVNSGALMVCSLIIYHGKTF